MCSFMYTRIGRVCVRESADEVCVCVSERGFKAESSLNDMVEMERVTLD